MSKPEFQVDQIDHIELFVPDRYETAKWYEKIFGLKIIKEYEYWAQNPRGPLMITTPKGETKLALFEGEPQQGRETAGFHRVAFRVSGTAFLEFLNRLSDLELFDATGNLVTEDQVSDHQSAYSIYFCDPYGHRLEVTTYDYQEVSKQLQ